MKKILYTLITFLAFSFGGSLNQLSAQCIDIAANGGAPWTNFVTLPVPCDDGTGCSISQITGFEVFASEAYNFPNLVGGVDYTFSICEGPGAGSWVPDFTVLDPAGDVVAFGAGNGDACSITWTASTDGEYVVIINEEKQCGGGSNLGTDNGFPSITCVNGPSCAPMNCVAGSLANAGVIPICEEGGTFDIILENSAVPKNGTFGIVAQNFLGGTGGGAAGDDGEIIIQLPGASFTSVDATLGVGIPPLVGPWVIKGLIFDTNNSVCSITSDSLIVGFGTESPFVTGFTTNGIDELTVSAMGGVEPYQYLWSDGQTTQVATGLAPDVVHEVTVSDLNGCSVTEQFSFTVSTDNIASLNELSILPNPSTGLFSIQLSFDQNEFVEVEVLNLTGKMIQTANRNLTSGQFDFDLSDAAAGVYFVRITAGEESITQRLILNK